MKRLYSICLGLLGASLVLTPQMAQACAVCYGNSDEPMSKALGWGVLALLLVVLGVLGGVSAFFIHVARRTAALAQSNQTTTLSDPTQKVS